MPGSGRKKSGPGPLLDCAIQIGTEKLVASIACLRARPKRPVCGVVGGFTGVASSLAGRLRRVTVARAGGGAEAVDAVEDRLGDGVLGGLRDPLLVGGGDQEDLVLGALEADRRVGDVVEDDHVGALAVELGAGAADRVAPVLGGEADDGLLLAALGG